MGFRSGAMMSLARVAAWTSSTVNSGLISFRTMPSGVMSITPISVMIMSTQFTAV